ncbi:ComF family protein [Paenibacillus cymbidii]|uniref:ComF family protein n=1 Tax=Paenibacillus cymbidii TaxID=1639034 RepID=UPI00108042DC|nr:ComF family protein [Paenibacillus cymbidii]
MIGSRESLIRKLLARLFGSAGSMLRESAPGACPICARRVRGVSAATLGLCPACAPAIPWIAAVRCATCGRGESCPDCGRRERTHFVQSRSAVRYDEAMRHLLARYKYRGDEALLALFARMLRKPYEAHISSPQLQGGFDCITYVPLNAGRLEERGFNQAEQMASALGSGVGVPVLPLLLRVRHTDKQSFKSRRERLADLSGAFAVDGGGMAELAATLADNRRRRIRVAVVDDVYTFT